MPYIGTARLLTTQSAAYTTTAGTTAAVVSNGVQKVRVMCTTDAFVKIAKSPTATTSDAYMVGLTTEYFSCAPGEKVSAVQVTTGGTLSVTEVP